MFKSKALVILGLLLLLLSACARAPVTTTDAQQDTTAASSPTAVPVQSISSNNPEIQDVAAEEPVDYCTSCHTDKQKLIDTAKPEEEVINENKGEG